MNKKELRYAFNQVLHAAEQVVCDDLHHTAKHLHEEGEICKAEYHLHRQIHIIREFMKEHGI